MNAKYAVIELVRSLPDDVSVPDIIRAIRGLSVLPKENPGEAVLEWSADEVSDADWQRIITDSLADELNDPTQDIYTLEDGQPYDVAR